MSVSSALHYLYEHPQTIMYAALILCLITAAILLLRGASDDHGAAKTGGASVDLNAMEALLKRIMAQAQGVPIAATAGGAPENSLAGDEASIASAKLAAAAADTSSGDTARLAVLVAERDKKITELQSALEEAKKASVASAPARGAEAAGDGGSSSPELQQKIKDLEARLAEYAIIEDDIADLSLFKEENQRLKAEVEEMRAKVAQATGGTEASPAPQAVAAVEAPAPTPAPAAAPAAVEEDPLLKEYEQAVASNSVPAIDVATSIPVAEPKAAAPAAATPVAQAAAEPVAEPVAAPAAVAASAVEAAATDPLSGTLDTDKMMQEVASLDTQSEGDGQDALIDSLDTDKLLAEVNELDSGNDPAPEEDLFGEFNDKEKA